MKFRLMKQNVNISLRVEFTPPLLLRVKNFKSSGEEDSVRSVSCILAECKNVAGLTEGDDYGNKNLWRFYLTRQVLGS